MDSVVHFEMPYEDKARVTEFYTKAFGWQANQLGPEMGEYITVSTAETDQDGMLKQPGAINGGLFKKSDDNKYPSVVIGVKDIREAMKRVEEAGGKILGGVTSTGPVEIPGIGLYIAILDTEGNRVSLLQPNQM